MKILVIGDAYMPPHYSRTVFAALETAHDIGYLEVDGSRPFTPRTAGWRCSTSCSHARTSCPSGAAAHPAILRRG